MQMESDSSRSLPLTPAAAERRALRWLPFAAVDTDPDGSRTPDCYRTDERFLCERRQCDVHENCTRLVAEWMR